MLHWGTLESLEGCVNAGLLTGNRRAPCPIEPIGSLRICKAKGLLDTPYLAESKGTAVGSGFRVVEIKKYEGLNMQQFSIKVRLDDADQTLERRTSRRYQLTLAVEVVELVSGTRLTGRTTDVCTGGCFMDSLIPLPVGSHVRVFLIKSGQEVHADGIVTYSQPGLGMGILFTNLIPEHRPLLDSWLLKSTGQHAPDLALSPKRAMKAEQSADSEEAVLSRLIHLLVARGTLSHADSVSLLRDPIIQPPRETTDLW